MNLEDKTTILDRDFVEGVIEKYGKAWVNRDSNLIATLFSVDAMYHEQVINDPIRGRRAIQQYWKNRVVRGQRNIEFRLQNLYIDGRTAIAEWQAEFDVVRTSTRIVMKQVAILEFSAGKIVSLREYWASRPIGKPKSTRPSSRPVSHSRNSSSRRRS